MLSNNHLGLSQHPETKAAGIFVPLKNMEQVRVLLSQLVDIYNKKVYEVAKFLQEKGIFTLAMAYPAVRIKEVGLRISI